MKIHGGISFKELAGLYFPNHSISSAPIQLRRWITLNSNLKEALQETGWQCRQRMLTPLQVHLIVEYLGEPDDE